MAKRAVKQDHIAREALIVHDFDKVANLNLFAHDLLELLIAIRAHQEFAVILFFILLSALIIFENIFDHWDTNDKHKRQKGKDPISRWCVQGWKELQDHDY